MDDQKPAEKEQSNDLFELRLNHSGVQSILRFAKMAKWMMGLVLVLALIELSSSLISIAVLRSGIYQYRDKNLADVVRRFSPFYTIIYIILAVIQTWFYVAAARQLSRSVKNHDTDMFNQAFASFYRNAVFGVIILILGLILDSLQLYILADLYYQYRQ
jgi:hypothetical protein